MLVNKVALLVLFIFLLQGAKAGYDRVLRVCLEITYAGDEKIEGYYYLTDTFIINTQFESDFKSFANKNKLFPLVVYKDIKSIEVVENLNIDFYIRDNILSFTEEDITGIKVKMLKIFPVGIEMVEVDKNDFNIIQPTSFYRGIIFNEKLSIKCTFYLLGWSNWFALNHRKNKMYRKIRRLVYRGKEDEVFEYVNQMKPDLQNKKIIIFYHCDELIKKTIPE